LLSLFIKTHEVCKGATGINRNAKSFIFVLVGHIFLTKKATQITPITSFERLTSVTCMAFR